MIEFKNSIDIIIQFLFNMVESNFQSKFMDQLFLQHKETGSTLIMVSHNSRITQYFDSVTRLEEIVA